jgi:RimJ/RimL family protein N-acetyltransferase
MVNIDVLDKLFKEQLKRLRTDYIDFYLMHMMSDIKVWERLKSIGIEKWIEDKKASGEIRNIGFSYHGNTEKFCEIIDAYDWDMTLIQYNYLDEHSQAGRKGLEYAYSKGIPVMIMEPLRGGKLVNNLPDEAKEEIDDEYLKMLEGLGEDDECCYLIPVFKDSLERVGTCSFMISEDKKVYDIAYCVHKNFWCQGYATEIAQGMIDYARGQGAEKVTIFVGQENAASNRVAQKCGGKIVSENTYKKRGTDIIMKDYKYEIIL